MAFSFAGGVVVVVVEKTNTECEFVKEGKSTKSHDFGL
jgi:hypothetical protein